MSDGIQAWDGTADAGEDGSCGRTAPNSCRYQCGGFSSYKLRSLHCVGPKILITPFIVVVIISFFIVTAPVAEQFIYV